MGTVSVQLGILAIAKDPAHADLADVGIVTERATAAGHRVVATHVVGDSEDVIREALQRWITDPTLDVVIVLGGADSDAVSSAMRPLVGHVLPGFTDLFRYLFFQEAGASAMLSAAEAARCSDTFVFVLPGAVASAMEKLILPQFDPTTTPKNLVGQMPRLRAERENAPVPTTDEQSAGHGVPREVKPEKTQGGSGVSARLPAMPAPKRDVKRTGANVIARNPAPIDPVTKPIDLEKLEQQIAASQVKEDVTRRTDLQKLLPKVPPGADELDDDDDVNDDLTHADIIAAPPAKSPFTIPAIAKPTPVARITPTPIPASQARPADRPTPVPSGKTPLPSLTKTGPAAKAEPVVARPEPVAKPESTKSGPGVADKRESKPVFAKSGDADVVPVAPVTIQPRKRESAEAKSIDKPEARSNGAAKHASDEARTMQRPAVPEPPTTVKRVDEAVTIAKRADDEAATIAKRADDAAFARRTDEAKRDDAKRTDEAKRDEAKRDEAKRDEAKRDEAKRDEAKRDEAKRDEARRDEALAQSRFDAAFAKPSARDLDETVPASRVSGSFGVLSDADLEPVDTDSDGADLDAIRAAATAQSDEAPTVSRAEPVRVKQPTTPPVTMVSAVPPAPTPRTRPPTAPPASTRAPTAPPATAAATSATDTPRARPATTPPPPRKSSELPSGTFNYPTQQKGMHWGVKLLLVLLVLGAGFGGFVFFFRDKLTGSDDAGSQQAARQIDAAVVATVEIDAAIVEADAAVEPEPEIEMTPTPTPTNTRPPRTRDEKPPKKPPPEKTPPENAVDAGVASLTPPTGPSNTPPGAGDDECDETACVLSKYEKPCCAKYKPADSTDLTVRTGGVPETLDKTMVRSGVNGVKPKVQKCGEKNPAKGTVKVAMTVSPEGAVTEASLADAPDSTLGECVVAAMKLAKFGKSVNGAQFTYPFVF